MSRLESSPATFANPTAIEQLRRVTRLRHERLHDHELFAGILTNDVTPIRMRTLLQAFYGFYRPLEPLLIQAARIAGRADLYDHPLRTQWLEQDLYLLGHDVKTLVSLSNFDETPDVAEPETLAGFLYVVEGSALGGRHIAKRWSSRSVTPPRFFTGYGKETSVRWDCTCRFIESVCRSPYKTEAAGRSAVIAFEFLQRWFDACCREMDL